MKFVPVLVLAALLPSFSLAASGFTIGGGLNSSFTNTEDRGEAVFTNRTGFNLGIGYEKEYRSRFSMMSEINLESRGEIGKQDDTPFGDIESQLNFLYLQIPVFYMIKVPTGIVTLDFFAGPELGILIWAKQETTIGGNTNTADRKDDLKPFDFGIEMGAGLELPLSHGTLFIRPSYYVGLVDIDDVDESDPDLEAQPIYLRNLKLKVGFKIPLRN